MNWAWWDGKMPVDHYRHEHELDHELDSKPDAWSTSDAAARPKNSDTGPAPQK